ncbi:MAG: helix-turn-helix domain-containing protein [Prevotella sp.]|nr:helix-turn-helix domain-containing protein [Prevotella sp.]
MEQKEFGRRLQAVRHKLGLTQSEVAEKVGVGFLTISRMERGDSVSSSTLMKVLNLYSPAVSLNALFADNFPENVEDVFKENRIEVPISYMANQAENLYKLVKDMNDAFEYGRNNLLPRLESTIKLL